MKLSYSSTFDAKRVFTFGSSLPKTLAQSSAMPIYGTEALEVFLACILLMALAKKC